MIQINIGDHKSIVPGFDPVPRGNRHMLTWSRERAIWISRNLPTANAYFRKLPFQRTLSSILADSNVWLNYEDNPKRFGATEPGQRREVAISSLSFKQGRWVVLATLIHELAHVGGAMGWGHDAEQAVLECGLGRRSEMIKNKNDHRTPYEPGIIGQVGTQDETAYA